MSKLISKDEYKELMDLRDNITDERQRKLMSKMLETYNLMYMNLSNKVHTKQSLAQKDIEIENMKREAKELNERLDVYRETVKQLVVDKRELMKQNRRIKERIFKNLSVIDEPIAEA